MKYFLLLISLIFSLTNSNAQNFDVYFINKTLRIDYIFSGDNNSQTVSLDQLNQLPQWAGRRHNLSELLRQGNGHIRVNELETGKCIYIDAFSTLFSEWQSTPEAERVRRSFENTFLVPYPKNKVSVEISLRDKSGRYQLAIKHIVDPNDIQIKKKGLKNSCWSASPAN